jgi:hypothetical protein
MLLFGLSSRHRTPDLGHIIKTISFPWLNSMQLNGLALITLQYKNDITRTTECSHCPWIPQRISPLPQSFTILRKSKYTFIIQGKVGNTSISAFPVNGVPSVSTGEKGGAQRSKIFCSRLPSTMGWTRYWLYCWLLKRRRVQFCPVSSECPTCPSWRAMTLLSSPCFVLFCFVFLVLEFEIRASPLLGRCSTTWATPPALFLCWVSQTICPGWSLSSWSLPP